MSEKRLIRKYNEWCHFLKGYAVRPECGGPRRFNIYSFNEYCRIRDMIEMRLTYRNMWE